MKTIIAFLAITLSAIAATSAAQSFGPPDPTPATAPTPIPPTVVEKPPVTEPATAPAPLTTLPSADSVLQELLKQQNPNLSNLASPTTKTAPQPAATAALFEMDGTLIRENQQVTQRTGHLAKDSAGHLKFIFDHAKPELVPMALIPSRRLAALEDATDNGTHPITFTIDAKVTEYRGQNYLYLQPTGGPPAPAPTPASAPAPAAGAPTNTLVPQTQAVAPNEPVVPRMREGDRITSRTGRYLKDEKTGAALFAFDSDGKQMTDPPLGLTPSRGLQTMEELSANATAAGNAIRFIVSGEVTQYRGKNYLWVQNVRAVHDLRGGIGR